MKSTGIVRKVDELGRVVIPIELRRTLGIEEKDPLEIYVDDNGSIILKKYSRGCAKCGQVKINLHYGLCRDCIRGLALDLPPGEIPEKRL